MIDATSRKSSSSKPRIVAAGVPMPDAGGDHRRPLVERHGVAVHGQPALLEPLLRGEPRPLGRAQVELHEVRVGAAGEHVEAAVDRARPRACRRSCAPAAGSRGTRRSPRSGSTSPSPRSCARAARPACRGRARGRPPARAPRVQSTKPARGPASVLCVVEVTKCECGTGFGCSPAATSPAKCAMSRHQQRADLVGDLAEPVGLDGARIGRAAADDQLRPHLLRLREHLVVVDDHRLARDAVVVELVELPGEVDLQPVRQVAAVVEREPEHPVARLRARRSRRPCSPARRRAAARSRARRRRAPSPARARAPRSRRRPRSRRSSACPGSPRRTCSSASSRPPRAPTAT